MRPFQSGGICLFAYTRNKFALTKDGADPGRFTLGSLGATTLIPGASATFTVTFCTKRLGRVR